MTLLEPKYERLSRSSSYDENVETKVCARGCIPREPDNRARKLVLASLCVFAVSIFALLATAILFYKRPTRLESAQKVSPYSPLWPVVEFWEGDFVNYFNHSTIYRGPPTLEREKAWDKLWNHTFIGVDSARLSELNRVDHGQFIPVIGSDPAHPTYAAKAEVFHQLHCLNLIRQFTWPLEKFDRSWGDVYPDLLTDSAVAVRLHIDHCIETLRLSLMCYSDITPMLVEKTPERVLGHRADFNVYHKCRNFEKIAQHVDETDYDIVLPPGRNDES